MAVVLEENGRSWAGTRGRPSGWVSGLIWGVRPGRSMLMAAAWRSTCMCVSVMALIRWPRLVLRSVRSCGS